MLNPTDLNDKEAFLARMKQAHEQGDAEFVAANLPKLRGVIRDCLDATSRLLDVQARAWEILLARDPDSVRELLNIPAKPSTTDPA